MDPYDISSGDVLQMVDPRGALDGREVIVLAVRDGKALVIDRERPKIRYSVATWRLAPGPRCAYCGERSSSRVCDDCDHLPALDDLAPSR